MLKLVGIVVFFLVFKGVSLTNAAELRIGVTYLSAPNPSLSIIQKQQTISTLILSTA